MNDDRLLSALKRLGHEELPTASDRAIRGRLETAWTTRARTVSTSIFSVRRFAPVLAALVLVAGFGGTALGASADSPLWDTRVALEEVGALLRSNDDRVAYLLDLVQSRTEEAARQEVLGHPDAAAKARVAASSAVFALDGHIPQIDTTVTLPLPTPTPEVASPTSSPSPSPTPTHTATPVVPSSPPSTRTSPPVAPTATPLRTETLRPVTPTPVPTRTATPTPTDSAKPSVTITGTVRDPNGAAVYGACISTSATFPTSTTACSVKTTTNGSYVISATGLQTGTTITLYAYWMSSTGQGYQGGATGTITAPTTLMPTINLTLRK